jgi:pyruvate/2-oxoglutarate dehydrogenase complex dihydrolipoamide acyltransferase (E2) component
VPAVEMRVPDIGDFSDVPVIELLVKPGDLIALEDPVATLESEKAALDVPATAAGRVLSVAVTPGTGVSSGAISGATRTIPGRLSASRTFPECANAPAEQ